MKRAFTLVEMLVVLAILAILTAMTGNAVAKAKLRAKFAKAEAETTAMTQAIYAYAQYTTDFTLTGFDRDRQEASKSSLNFLLGSEAGAVGRDGISVPVLYNASTAGNDGRFLDPWGRAYLVTIKKTTGDSANGMDSITMGVYLPNCHRLNDGERIWKKADKEGQ